MNIKGLCWGKKDSHTVVFIGFEWCIAGKLMLSVSGELFSPCHVLERKIYIANGAGGLGFVLMAALADFASALFENSARPWEKGKEIKAPV